MTCGSTSKSKGLSALTARLHIIAVVRGLHDETEEIRTSDADLEEPVGPSPAPLAITRSLLDPVYPPTSQNKAPSHNLLPL